MILLFDVTLPFTDPVLIFSLVLFIILLAPLVLNRFKVPGIIGLILAGVLVGPNGLNLLLRDSSIILFGTVGLLYIMFLAGLEIDLNDFIKNRNRSLVFGIFTFVIPQGLGILASYYILGFNLQSSILLASMFASHTLLAYPILGRFGISKNEAVTITVGGTIITDTAALLVLAVITGSAQGGLTNEFWLRLGVSLAVFSFIVLWVFPRIGAWFFKNIEGEGGAQFIFVLAIVFAASFLAELAGVEPIIGAFLAGLALNRLIPHTSPLMNRIEFVGNTLFIPFFLISVGMLVDFRVLFKGPEALLVAATMIVVATACKWLAAYFTQKVFKYSRVERNIIFGLSNAQAAATLAAVLIGYQLELLNENVLNGTILMILVTCLISSFVTEKAGRELAIIESDKAPNLGEVPERILVPISNPSTIEYLIDLAVMIKDPKSPEPIYPLSVVKDDEAAKEQIIISNKMLEKAIKHASATEHAVQVVTRVDLHIASGVARAIKELLITDIIIGWNGKITTREKIFGTVLDSLLQSTEQTVLVSKITSPLNTMKRLVVVVPPNAEVEVGFAHWIRTIKTMSKQTGADIVFFGAKATQEKIADIVAGTRPAVEAGYNFFEDWEDFLILSRDIRPDDLVIIVSARKGSLSYNHHLDSVPRQLSKYFQQNNFVIIYPEQYAGSAPDKGTQLNNLTMIAVPKSHERPKRG
jgi:Kef-type K+ transport system membrane component KefB